MGHYKHNILLPPLCPVKAPPHCSSDSSGSNYRSVISDRRDISDISDISDINDRRDSCDISDSNDTSDSCDIGDTGDSCDNIGIRENIVTAVPKLIMPTILFVKSNISLM